MRNAFTEELLARRPSRVVLFLIGLVFFSAPAWAQNENETVGFQSTHIFEGGQFGENIDILNGGLSLAVPLGPHYQVNSRLGYQMRLAYDSKVWDSGGLYETVIRRDYLMMPYNEGPNGFGMSMQMGRIMIEQKYMEGTDPYKNYYDKFSRSYKWIAPDGSQHEFYFDDRLDLTNGQEFRENPGVTIQPGGEPSFFNRKTTDGSFVSISGPADGYCYPVIDPATGLPDPQTQHGCYQVLTPDGLIYSLAKRVNCFDALPVPVLRSTDQTYAEARSNLQSFCGWYTTLIEDPSVGPTQIRFSSASPITTPYPNHVKVTYKTTSGFEHVIAKVQDSTGRVVSASSCQLYESSPFVYTCKSPQDTIASNPNMRHTVAITGIDVPGSGTAQAGAPVDNAVNFHYGFTYRITPILKPFAYADYPNGGVLFLTGIDYPTFALASGGAGLPISMYFGYNQYGELSCRTVPVESTAGYGCGAPVVPPDTPKAAFIYSFGWYSYVGRYISGGIQGHSLKGGGIYSSFPDATGVSRQMYQKRLQLQAGTTAGTWTYDRGEPTSSTNPTRVKVTDPFGNDTIYYYNGSPPPPPVAGSNLTGGSAEDGYAPEWDDGTNSRIDYYEGPESSGNIVRSELQEYDSDIDTTNGVVHSKINVRTKRSVTRYVDAGGKEKVTTRLNWDGFGHWEVEAESGFGLPENRTTFTKYDASFGSVYDTNRPLIKEVSDGRKVLSRTDYSYTDGTQPVRFVLAYSLDRVTPPGKLMGPPDTTPRPGDVMTKYSYSLNSISGNVVKKELYSDAIAASPTYAIFYTWAPVGLSGTTCTVPNECGGYLATKAFQNGSGPAPWNAIDRSRDGNTGVILSTRDTAGIQTNYTYDSLGRVKTVAPLGEDATSIEYLDLKTTQVTQGSPAGTDYIRSTYRYDTLGRLVAEEKRPADPARGNICQRTIHDLDGGVTYKTEAAYVPAGTCTALPSPLSCWSGLTPTQLSQYPGTESDLRNPDTGACDPFGRVHLEIPADATRSSSDKMIRTDYTGLDTKVTVYGVRAWNQVAFNSVSTFYRDAFNRLITVDQATGATDAANYADANYTYDVLDRLSVVELTDDQIGGKRQYRSFAYDGLGRMLWAQNPESGTTVYGGYDALGNPLRVQDAKGNVQKFYYDFAGRLWRKSVIPVGSATESTVAKNVYDELGRGSSLGKLTTIQSDDEAGNLLLTERRIYSGTPGGRLSQTTHDFYPYWDLSSAVTTNYTYTNRGELASINYPQESPTTRTVLTVNYTNLNGFVTKASEQENDPLFVARDLVTMTYNAAGALETMTALGGTGGKTTITYDIRNRPKTITGGVLTNSVWTYQSGGYSYDGAGNIYALGGDGFGYDQANRLVKAITWDKSGTSYNEDFTYDIFGNMAAHQLAINGSGYIENDNFMFDAPLTPNTNRILSQSTRTQSGGTDTTGNIVPFTYDANGNLVEGGKNWWDCCPAPQPTDDIKRYQYGPLNRLQAIEQKTGPAQASLVDQFAYDTTGDRLWRVEKGSGLLVYSVRDPNGRVLSEFRAPSLANSRSVEWAADYIYAGGRLVSMKQNQTPRPPVNLSALPYPSGSSWQIVLKWDANPETNVTYKVYRLRDGIDPGFVALTPLPASPTFTDPTLFASNQGLHYKVTCVDATTGLESQPSSEVFLKTGDITGPAAPLLTGTAGDRVAMLSWSMPTDISGIAGFMVYRHLAPGAGLGAISPQLIKGTSFVDIGLTNGTTYLYLIQAIDNAGNGGPYSCVPNQPFYCDTAVTPHNQAPPSPPSGVTATVACSVNGAPETIVVSWTPNAAKECADTGCTYDLYSTGPTLNSWFKIVSGLTITTFTDSGYHTPGDSYYYAVFASSGYGAASTGSQMSQVVAAATRDTTTMVTVQPFAKASDGKVLLRWVPPEDPVTHQPLTIDYRVYRRANPSTSCNDYVQVGKAGWNPSVSHVIQEWAWEFTDGTVENNLGYEYALTQVVNGVESSFSKPVLAIPVSRPSNLFQCQGGGYLATLLQWTPPPDATPYHPATYQSGEFGYLMGYHMYHHKECSPPFTFTDATTGTQYTIFYDNSPIREMVFNDDLLDPYIIRKRLPSPQFEYEDPRVPIGLGTDSPLFSPAWPPPTSGPTAVDLLALSSGSSNGACPYSGINESNCMMPKAAYKVYAEGMWLPAESDWPEYFNPYAADLSSRCGITLRSALGSTGLEDCRNFTTNPNFMPPPRKVTATSQLGDSQASITWQAPLIQPGKPALAGFYVYGSVYEGSSCGGDGGYTLRTFRPPLPVATLGPNDTQTSIPTPAIGTYTFRVAAFDAAGHVSGDAPYKCNTSGADCSGALLCPSICSLTKDTCGGSTPCSNTSSCSVTLAPCSPTQNTCATQLCSNNYNDFCSAQPPPPIVAKQVVSTTNNGIGSTLSLTLSPAPTDGDALIAVVGTYTGQVVSISQTNVTWQTAKISLGSFGSRIEIWYALNVHSAVAGISIRLTSGTTASAIVREYSGIKQTAALDRTSALSGFGKQGSTGTTLTTTMARELWIGAISGITPAATFSNQTTGWTEVLEAPGVQSLNTGENTVYYDRIVSTTGLANVTAAISKGTYWAGAAATFRGADPPAPCPGISGGPAGTCLTQTCNLSTRNACQATDVCAQTLARWCQSDPTAPCEVASDCPHWSNQAHCSVTTGTLCNPTAPTAGCPATEVCVPGDSCHNSTDNCDPVTGNCSTSVLLTGGSNCPPATPNPHLPYDATTIPPPQSFRAWAPMNGTSDQKDIYLKWCPEPVTGVAARTMPTVTEYDVYRSRNRGGPHKLFAKISPNCLSTVSRCSSSGIFCATPGSQSNCSLGETCLVQGNRCEIWDPADPRSAGAANRVACVKRYDGTDNPSCDVILPMAACSNQTGATAPRCAIVDETFDTFSAYPNPYHSPAQDEQYNYFYAVTAKGTLNSVPVPESGPSVENAGWLNYYIDSTSYQRRDPDGDGEFLVCSDGHIESSLDYDLLQAVPASRIDPAPAGSASAGSAAVESSDPMPMADAPLLEESLAPYRSMGAGGLKFTYKPPSKFIFYHDDHLGSPRVEVDDKGVVAATHHYLPFGDERPFPADPVWGNRAFTGHERDKESGLDYMLARYYSSSLGRFMAVDPGGDTALGDPQSWNKYAYVRNNPLKFNDPNGQDAQLAEGMSRSDKKRMVATLAKAARNPDFKQKLQSIDASDKKVTFGTAELRNDFETTPGAKTGTVQVGHTDPTLDASGSVTGAEVTVDFGNVDFSQQTTDPKTDVETVAHETAHGDNILNGVPGTAAEEAGAKQFGKGVDADSKTKAEPTRKEKKEIKKILEPKK